MERPVAIAIQPAPDGADPLDAPLDTHFGRAKAFLLVRADGGTPEVIPNEHVEAAHGAGTAVVGALAERRVGTVIAADYGPNAFRALNAARVAAWKAAPGTPARTCLDLLRDGALEAMKMDVYA